MGSSLYWPFPGALQPITSQNLQAVSNSPIGSTALYYSIEQAPRLGRLSTSWGEEIRNFTQAQVSFHLPYLPRTLRPSHPSPSTTAWGSQHNSPAATGTQALAKLRLPRGFPSSAGSC